MIKTMKKWITTMFIVLLVIFAGSYAGAELTEILKVFSIIGAGICCWYTGFIIAEQD